ncbi:retention module-containing protein, partial [Marinobacterium sedimentorum]|uniref:retention module-containing protein n=1 Tax=Marinobacterium sedimentorum TaxID=2927804 RepID=UPI0020C6B1E8
MAIGDVAGNVSFIFGTVVAVGTDGVERVLSLGDPLYEGDQIRVADGGRIEIAAANGEMLALGSGQEATVDAGFLTANSGDGQSQNQDVAATVTSISGTVVAVAADGSERILAVGDVLFEGELIRVASGGSVQLIGASGETVALASGQQALITPEFYADAAQFDSSQSVASSQSADQALQQTGEIDAIQAAILAGEDPTAVAEATAAGQAPGEAGGPGDSGSSFVQLSRTGQEVTPEAGYQTSGLSRGFTAPNNEDVLITPADPVVSVTVEVDVETPPSGGEPPTEPTTEFPVLVDGNSVTVLEGTGGGERQVTFLLTLDKASDQVISVTYELRDLSTTYLEDWHNGGARVHTVDIPAGETQFPVTVYITEDALFEGNEVLDIVLLSASNATISSSQSQAQITIFDDDIPVFTLSGDESVGEGFAADYSIALSGAELQAGQVIKLSIGTGLGLDSAQENVDYNSADGVLTVTVPAGGMGIGDTVATFKVTTLADGVDEADESFSVVLQSATVNGQPAIVQDTVTTTILDADVPTVEFKDAGTGVGDIEVPEGADAVFTLNISKAAAGSSLVLSLADGTAVDADYNEAHYQYSIDNGVTWSDVVGPITLADGGDYTVLISTDTVADGLDETSEIFNLSASLNSNGDIYGDSAVGTILDGDPATVFSVDDVSVDEGGNLVFTVTRSGDAQANQSVTITTSDGTATLAGGDYTANSETLTFAQGETSKTFTVATNDDALFESSENINVTLSNATNGAVIGDGAGVGTILDNDAAPVFSVDDVQVTEGGNLVFTVTRTGDAQANQAVTITTSDGTATLAGGDYSANSETLTFAQGETSKTFTVATNEDALFESSENINVTLSNATNGAVIGDGAGVGTILDNDAAPVFSVDDVQVTEGGNLVFTVTRSGDAQANQAVTITTSDGTATLAGGDYTANSKTLTFAQGETSKTFTVATNDDALFESSENINVTLSNATNGAVIGDGAGVGTILDNDAAPVFSVDDVSVDEGGNLVFTVTRSGDAQANQSVTITTSDGTATLAGGDYTANSETLTFAQGETSKTFTVATN